MSEISAGYYDPMILIKDVVGRLLPRAARAAAKRRDLPVADFLLPAGLGPSAVKAALPGAAVLLTQRDQRRSLASTWDAIDEQEAEEYRRRRSGRPGGVL